MIEMMTVARNTRRKRVGIENIFMVPQVISAAEDIVRMMSLVNLGNFLNFLTFVHNINKPAVTRT